MNTGERRNDFRFSLFLTEETFIKKPMVPVGSHLLLPFLSVLRVHFPSFSGEEESQTPGGISTHAHVLMDSAHLLA